MRPQGLTTAKTVAKISVVSNTAGEKKSVPRRSTDLDYSSSAAEPGQLTRITFVKPAMKNVAKLCQDLQEPTDRTQRSSLPISTPVTRTALGPWVCCFHFAEEGLEDLAEAFRLLDRGHVRALLEDDPLGASDAVGDRADHGGGGEVVAT
jgi:hypothetical protein